MRKYAINLLEINYFITEYISDKLLNERLCWLSDNAYENVDRNLT